MHGATSSAIQASSKVGTNVPHSRCLAVHEQDVSDAVQDVLENRGPDYGTEEGPVNDDSRGRLQKVPQDC